MNVKLAKEQNEIVQSLKLADNGDNKSGNVDMLIGADVYWDIVTGNIKRNLNTGLVAISSAFGWLMNGPVTDRSDKSEEKLNVAVAHVMRVQCEKAKKNYCPKELTIFGV